MKSFWIIKQMQTSLVIRVISDAKITILNSVI